MKRIAVIDSRKFNDYTLLKAKLDHLLQNITEDIQIVSGGAIGADTLAIRYAKEKGYEWKEYLPEYDKYPGKIAPLKRNRVIMQNADMVVAFSNGSSGTENALSHAREFNLPIRVIAFR